MNQGRKVACFPVSPLSSCLLACSGGHWFLENGKKKKNVVPKTSSCGRAWFFFLCVCVCLCVHILAFTQTHVCEKDLWAFVQGALVWRSEENLWSWFCPTVCAWAALWSAGFAHTSAFTHCPLLLCCCARTLGGREGLFEHAGYSLSLREGTWRQEQNERPWRNTPHWFALCGLLSLLSYTTQDSLSRGGTARSGLGPTHLSTGYLMTVIPQVRGLFPDDSSLCQVDKTEH